MATPRAATRTKSANTGKLRKPLPTGPVAVGLARGRSAVAPPAPPAAAAPPVAAAPAPAAATPAAPAGNPKRKRAKSTRGYHKSEAQMLKEAARKGRALAVKDNARQRNAANRKTPTKVEADKLKAEKALSNAAYKAAHGKNPKRGAGRGKAVAKEWQFLAAKLAAHMEKLKPNITTAEIIREL